MVSNGRRPARPSSRARRHALLREIVAHEPVPSQTELVTRLEAGGVEATQATVSRDLDELGIFKQRGADGRVTYALPEPAGLAQLLRQFVISIAASGNLAVVRTPPGAAATVASAIDHADVPGVLATVQGDDTLLVVATEGTSGKVIAERLTGIANPSSHAPTPAQPAPAYPKEDS
ncbi:MAG: arginine repressor [Nitriliruptorales bacterium]|nr:arginine repressor [Nitriliruptorales bacterium]